MTATIDRLLAAVRHRTGIDDLDWATQPRPLTGGFWAEMYTVELADPPEHLAGRLVARIMPDPATAAYETTIQHHLHQHGLSVPAIRAADGPTEHLDRAWSLMDHANGRPLLAGLNATTAIRQAPTLLRCLPDLLAEAAAAVHHCPIDGLDLALNGHTRRPDITDFLQRVAQQAVTVGRNDLAASAGSITANAPHTRTICHGDLHPFNLLVEGQHWTLIDWSTAVLADPHYDLAFTSLMLANPPLGGPAPVRAATRAVGVRLANRFLRTYQDRTGNQIDPDRLAWGRQAHALRALVEIATWEANGELHTHAGHPWLTMQPVLEGHVTRC